MNSDPIEVQSPERIAQRMRYLAKQMDAAPFTKGDKLRALADQVASLSAPKPESAEAVCPECHGAGGQRWYEADGSERGERCGTCDGFGAAPLRPEASAPVGVEGLVKAMRMLAGVGIPVKPECVGRWADQLEALAQQPAAVDGAAPLTERQAVIVTGYTGVLCSSFDAFHADLEKRAGRPVLTHEMADVGWIKPLYRDDFLGLAGQQQGETP